MIANSTLGKKPYQKWIVWNGYEDVETWAVSARKAMANVAWRLRQRGGFPLMSVFEVRRAGGSDCGGGMR